MAEEKDVGVFCAKYGQESVIYFDVIYPIIYGTGGLLLLPLICIFLWSYQASKLQISRSLFAVSLFYFCIQLSTYICAVFWSSFECHSRKIASLLQKILIYLFSTQTLMLSALLFHRLYVTYEGVPGLQLSKCSIVAFIIFYLIAAVVFLFGAFLYTAYPTGIGAQSIGISSVLIQILGIALFIIYVFKLYTVRNRSNAQDKSSNEEIFMAVILKISVLAFVSVLVTFITSIAIIVLPLFQSPHIELFLDLSIIVDVYTNATCIFLSYAPFNELYLKVCGCCQQKCVSKCIPKEPKTIMKQQSVTLQIPHRVGHVGVNRVLSLSTSFNSEETVTPDDINSPTSKDL